MPPPSKISQLPEEMRAELDRRLLANGFSDVVALAEWLSSEGYEISKTTVGKHSKDLKEATARNVARIRAVTQMARQINEAAEDDAANRSNAIIGLAQVEIFECLQALESAASVKDPVKRLGVLGKAAAHIATLSRASVTRNKWAMEMRETARQELLKEQESRLDEAIRAQGLDEESARFWRERVLMGER